MIAKGLMSLSQTTVLESLGILVGVVAGVAGFVLGILNYLHQRSRSRPILIVQVGVWVQPDRGYGEGPKRFGMFRVINAGAIPVMPMSIAFGTPNRGGTALVFPNPFVINGQGLNQELKPGHVAALGFDLEGLPPSNMLGRAEVWTTTGERFRASNKTMARFVNELNNQPNK